MSTTERDRQADFERVLDFEEVFPVPPPEVAPEPKLDDP